MDLTNKALKLTPRQLEICSQLGWKDTDDVLEYYPFRYEILNVQSFDNWKIDDKVSFQGTVCSNVNTFHKGYLSISSFSVMMEDHVLRITIYNRPWIKNISCDSTITINGIYKGRSNVTATSYDLKPLIEHKSITPIYSTKDGIRQNTIQTILKKVFTTIAASIEDWVPENLMKQYHLLSKRSAIEKMHFPTNKGDIEAAQRTLKYEEFLLYFTSVGIWRKMNLENTYKTPRLFEMHKVKKVIHSLPYPLTDGQKYALKDIFEDMQSKRLMYRLVQGDVGCGKTTVAVLALYACVLSGYQGALLAPTEILAKQHLESLRSILKNCSLQIEVLYSSLSSSEKKAILKRTAEGKIDILIGTHSLLQDNVQFRCLGMVVTDEQQRFGVTQRKALRLKGKEVDFLLMSATPIPRTLASAFLGDMDVSTIESMPEGRKEPITKLINKNGFYPIRKEVENLLADGHQLYVICAAKEKNELQSVRNVHDVYESLQANFPEYRCDILNGSMSSEEKQEAMQRFAEGKTRILISTTVVEVGMNVVNATEMIVYNAERFGLSQLHQLRGRIQRGSTQGHCWLLTDSNDKDTLERLNVLVETNNGFKIAYEDLRQRGPGDILGTRQSGLPGFILGNLTYDTKIMNQARIDSDKILDDSGNPMYKKLIQRASTNFMESYID